MVRVVREHRPGAIELLDQQQAGQPRMQGELGHGYAQGGQAALGIEICAGRPELAAWLAPLHDPASAHCVRAERAFSRALGGSCQLPLGAYATLADRQLYLRGFVATPDGQKMLAGELRGPADEDESLGERLAQQLRAQGAEAILCRQP